MAMVVAGYLIFMHEDAEPTHPELKVCTPGSNIYHYQTKEHSESGIYTCNETGTKWDFTEPCTEDFITETVIINGSAEFKLTCRVPFIRPTKSLN